VSKVLKGTRPANIPIGLDHLFLSINITTAQAIGINIPAGLAARGSAAE
jgi:hypothetical protein